MNVTRDWEHMAVTEDGQIIHDGNFLQVIEGIYMKHIDAVTVCNFKDSF